MPTIISINAPGAVQSVRGLWRPQVGFNILYNAMNNAYPAQAAKLETCLPPVRISRQACQMDTRLLGQQLNGSFFSLGDSFGDMHPGMESRRS